MDDNELIEWHKEVFGEYPTDGVLAFIREAIKRANVEAALEQAPTAMPLDMPDGEGWHVFEGTIEYGITKLPIRDAFSVHDHGGYLLAQGVSKTYSVNFMVGKWYRLYMPWETRAATAQEDSDE